MLLLHRATHKHSQQKHPQAHRFTLRKAALESVRRSERAYWWQACFHSARMIFILAVSIFR